MGAYEQQIANNAAAIQKILDDAKKIIQLPGKTSDVQGDDLVALYEKITGNTVSVTVSKLIGALSSDDISNASDVSGVSVTDALNQILLRTYWKGQWSQQTYYSRDQVYDNGYLAIVNKESTTDRPSPQPTTSPEWTLPETPGWNELTIEDTVYQMLRVSNVTGLASFDKYRVWIQDTSATARYQTYKIDNITGVISEGRSYSGTDFDYVGWHEIPVEIQYINIGDDVSFVLASQKFSGTLDFDFQYYFTRPNNNDVPESGEVARRGDNTELRINYIDDGGINRSAQITQLQNGSVVRLVQGDEPARYLDYTVVNNQDLGTYAEITVTLNQTGSGGAVQNDEFGTLYLEILIPEIVNYVTITDYYTGFPQISGGIKIGDGAVTENQDACCIDIQITLYDISADWDIQSYPGGGDSSSGGGDLSNYVDLTSEQVITGLKTFTQFVHTLGVYIDPQPAELSMLLSDGSVSAEYIEKLFAGSGVIVDTSNPKQPIISAIPGSTAGIFRLLYFTGDETTTTGGTFFLTQPLTEGVVESAPQTESVADLQTSWYAQDLLGPVSTEEATVQAGDYSGELAVQLTGNNNSRFNFTVEVYISDVNGVPIDSGIVGQAVGDLGVRPVAILTSGASDLPSNDEVNRTITGSVLAEYTQPINTRGRYHVAVTKVDTAGPTADVTLFYGTLHSGFVSVPVSMNTDNVLNKSNVAGATATDALNALVTKATAETITGQKTFSQPIILSLTGESSGVIKGDELRYTNQDGNYTIFSVNGMAWFKEGDDFLTSFYARTQTANRTIFLPDTSGDVVVSDWGLTEQLVSPIVGATTVIDWAAGDAFMINDADEALTIVFTNLPPSGRVKQISVYVKGNRPITLPSGIYISNEGVPSGTLWNQLVFEVLDVTGDVVNFGTVQINILDNQTP